MKVISLFVQNVKRIKVAEFRPKKQSVIVVGGQNDNGKSSLLDAIEMALGGKSTHPKEPLRRGAKSGRVVVELDELVVTRTFSAGGGTELKVESRAGKRFGSPQAMLDKLFSRLTFDPLAFERQDGDKQSEIIRQVVGLDFKDLDERRASLYDQRTDENRNVRALQVSHDATSHYDDAPEDEVSIEALTRELEQAESLQRAADRAERELEQAESEMTRLGAAIQEQRTRETELLRMLDETRRKIESLSRDQEAQDATVSARAEASQTAAEAVPNTAGIRQRLAEADAINQKVRQNRQHLETLSMLEEARARVTRLTADIDAIDEDKAERLATAKYPVAGLGMSPDGTVLFNGIPFDQASTSDRIRVSVAIGLAMHPKLRVLLVRDGSLIGEAKLKIIEEMIRDADAQLWIEMMQESPNDRTTIFIHDGMIASEGKTDGRAAAEA